MRAFVRGSRWVDDEAGCRGDWYDHGGQATLDPEQAVSCTPRATPTVKKRMAKSGPSPLVTPKITVDHKDHRDGVRREEVHVE
jgi:hypothetical protein